MLNYLFFLLTIWSIVLILFVFQRHISTLKLHNDRRLELLGYYLFRSDHPSNNERGGVCIYYKLTPPLRILNISNLDEHISFEVSVANKVSRVIQLYRSPSQRQDEFQEFRSNLEMTLDALSTNNPFLTVMIGDFNAISSN